MRNTEDEGGIRHSMRNIHSLFLNRWSSRSMIGEGINDEDLISLVEAGAILL